MCGSQTLIFSVKALSNQIKRLIDYQASQNNTETLTGMQYGVIRYVGYHSMQQDIFQKDIENIFNIRRSTATGILQLMEKKGLLKRIVVEYDARLKKIVLTDRAIKIYQRATQGIVEIETQLIQGLSQRELDTFFNIINKISNNISKISNNINNE